MPLSMYAITVPVFTRYLNNLDAILVKAEVNAAERKIKPEVLVASRLAPDMHPLSFQVQSTTDRIKFTLARLTGRTPPSWEDNETTLADLRARIRKALEFVASLLRGRSGRQRGQDADAESARRGHAGAGDRARDAERRAADLLPHHLGLRDPAPQRRADRQARLYGRLTRRGRSSSATDGLLAAGALRGWLESGHSVAALWTSADPAAAGCDWPTSSHPRWSARRLLQRHAVPAVSGAAPARLERR
jgi:predicted nucleic acid-binding protein